MITKWAKRFLRVRTADSAFPGTGGVGGTSGGAKSYFEFKNSAGDTHYGGAVGTVPTIALLTSLTASGSNSSAGFALGSGTTTPTEDDYTIETLISSGLSLTATPAKIQAYDSVNDVYSIFFDLAINNTSSAEITISEICMFQIMYGTTNLGDNVNTGFAYKNSVMLDRTVLDTPLVLPAGQGATLRYSFDF